MRRSTAILSVVGTLVLSACAGGNWQRFRPERYEAAKSDNQAVIRASTYDALTQVQSLSSKGQHVDALDRLEDLEPQVKDIPNERALLYQARAYVLMTMGRLNDAAPAIEEALAPETLPEQTAHDLRYNLAQIYVQQEKFKKAAPLLELWIAQAESPEPDVLALLSYIYYQDGKHDLAANYAKRAIRNRPDNDDWRNILLSCQFELKRYAQAKKTLMHLIGRKPTDPQHWRTLSQLDLLLEHPDSALVSMEVLGDLSTLEPHEIVQLARLSLVQELPARAAAILSSALQERRIKPSYEHWSLLGHAQLAAKNFPQAIEAFVQSRDLQSDPARKSDLCLRLAGLAMRMGEWKEAQVHAGCAGEHPDPQIKANADLILGISNYQTRNFEASLAALRSAKQHASTRASAGQWEAMVLVQRENLATIAGGAASDVPPELSRR